MVTEASTVRIEIQNSHIYLLAGNNYTSRRTRPGAPCKVRLELCRKAVQDSTESSQESRFSGRWKETESRCVSRGVGVSRDDSVTPSTSTTSPIVGTGCFLSPSSPSFSSLSVHCEYDTLSLFAGESGPGLKSQQPSIVWYLLRTPHSHSCFKPQSRYILIMSRSTLNDGLFANGPSWAPAASQVELLISRACNPTLPDPNYALNLEVADYINQKKANSCVSTTLTVIGFTPISFITPGPGRLRC